MLAHQKQSLQTLLERFIYIFFLNQFNTFVFYSFLFKLCFNNILIKSCRKLALKEEEAAEIDLSRDTGTADVEKKKDPKLFKNLRELLW